MAKISRLGPLPLSHEIMKLARGGSRKEWVHAAFRDGRCRYCGGEINSRNTTVKKHHLLNPRACSAYLWSEDAARSLDPEVQALLANLIAAGGDPRQATRRGAASTQESAVASFFHARAPAPYPLTPPPATVDPDGGQASLLQRVADSGGAESLLLALTRRCDSLEAQNAVLRTKVLQLYPPGAPRAAEIANLLATLRGDQHRSSDASGQLEPPELRRPSAIGVLQQQQPYLQRPGQEPSYLQPSFPQPIQQLSSFLQPAQQSAYLQPAQQQQLQAYLQQPGLEQSYLQPSYLQPAQQLCLSSAGDFLQPPDQAARGLASSPRGEALQANSHMVQSPGGEAALGPHQTDSHMSQSPREAAPGQQYTNSHFVQSAAPVPQANGIDENGSGEKWAGGGHSSPGDAAAAVGNKRGGAFADDTDDSDEPMRASTQQLQQPGAVPSALMPGDGSPQQQPLQQQQQLPWVGAVTGTVSAGEPPAGERAPMQWEAAAAGDGSGVEPAARGHSPRAPRQAHELSLQERIALAEEEVKATPQVASCSTN